MRYTYRAKRGTEEIIEGALDAPSEKDAVERLSQMGYIPIKLEATSGAAPGSQTGRVTSPPKRFNAKAKTKDITIFSRQLASLIKSGVPILSALGIIQEQAESKLLKEMLGTINAEIKNGATFSSALALYPQTFPPLFVAMIRTGEDSGSLPEALRRIADHRAKQEEMISRFRMAMAYPILMSLVGVATILFMLGFVMPRLTGIFSSMGQALPLPTRILISTSERVRQWWFWILITVALFAVIIRRESKTKAGRLTLSALALHMPVLGSFTLKAELARFTRTLELLIRSGIPILKAIEISIPVMENEIIKNQLARSYKELEQGGSFGKSLKGAKLFPLFLTNLLIVGEESGRLDDALAEVAGTYERDTDEAMKVMASLLEPLIILVMGLIVGFIVVAMLLPIFEINVMVH